MSETVLSWRIEVNDSGPFWDEKNYRRLIRECRKITPEWKDVSPKESSFLESYVIRAPSPYDTPAFDYLLSKHPEKDWEFGFLSKEMMIQGFALNDTLFKKQFLGLLNCKAAVTLSIYMVKALAVSELECIYHHKDRELIQVINSSEEFESA